MKSFDIDLYLWHQPAQDWLFVPPSLEKLQWPAELSQSEILACDAGVTFRVDDVLWLGNERDIFPIEVLVSELYQTLVKDNDSITRLTVSEYLAIEIDQSQENKITLSRIYNRDEKNYLDQIAETVGTYYKNFVVPEDLWRRAVEKTIDSLVIAFYHSRVDNLADNQSLANWLYERFQKLDG